MTSSHKSDVRPIMRFAPRKTARKFLNQLHSEEKMAEAKQRRAPEQIAFIPE